MKRKALVLIFLAIFAAFTTLTVVGSSTQINGGGRSLPSLHDIIQLGIKLVQPCGFPIDSPGGPT